MSRDQIDGVLQAVRSGPEEDQEELIEIIREIEARRSGAYHASPDELKAIDEADRSGVATDEEVEAAFRSFRRARGLSILSRRSAIFGKSPPRVVEYLGTELLRH